MIPAGYRPVRPNVPRSKVTLLMAASRLFSGSAEKLESLGVGVVPAGDIPAVDGRLAHHIDLGFCLAGEGTMFALASCKDDLSIPGLKIIKGAGDPGKRYPDDCRFNVLISGKHAIHNFRYTDRKLYGYLEQHYELIDIKQGYAKCMVSVISEKCMITQDAGIARELERRGFDVLYIKETKIRLEGFPYGFIGGASFLLDKDIWCLNGSLDRLDSCYNIEDKLSAEGIGIICLNDEDPVDVGSFIQIFEEERYDEKELK